MGSKIKILDSEAVSQKLKRLAWEVYEDNYKEKEIFIVGVSNRGLKIAKEVQDKEKKSES